MSDFEKAIRKAASIIWPEAEIKGCMFHYIQALRRKFQSMIHLKRIIKHNENARRAQLMFYRLCLLPPDKIFEGGIAIHEFLVEKNMINDFKGFNRYFVDYWIKSVKPEGFSVFDRRHRTNNILESFNAKLKRFIKVKPRFFQFLGRNKNSFKFIT